MVVSHFFFLPLLRRTIAHAAYRGYSSSVTTNGFWAQSRSVLRQLNLMRNDGLSSVSISTSLFHQEFVSLDRVIIAAREVLNAGLKVTINVVTSEGFDEREVISAIDEFAEDENFSLVVMPCLPAGRARIDVDTSEYTKKSFTPSGNCSTHFRKLAVDKRGDVYPCCSPGGFTPPLRMGNVHERVLTDIIKDSADNALLAILESVGPVYFLPFLRSRFRESEFEDRYSDQCHLCHEIMSSPAYLEAINEATDVLIPQLRKAGKTVTISGERLERIVFHKNV